MRLPILFFHICAGAMGLLSGAIAIAFRKGSRGHLRSGIVFVIAMLCMSASAAYLAFMKSQVPNVLGGILTFYLVSTGWATARIKEGETNSFEWAAFLFALAFGCGQVILGLEAAHSRTGLQYGYPAGMYFFMSSVLLLAAAGDFRMLLRGGIFGVQRLARHLWRMCCGLFVAAASVFIGRPQIFPAVLRETGALFFLGMLPLLLMIFWLVRVRVAGVNKQTMGREDAVSV
jgi:hypothetical protein